MRKLLTHRRGSTSKEVFWKYLGSYVCIALLPMIMNSVLSYTLIRDYLTNQVDQNRTEAISYTEHMLEQQISSLVSIASEMSMKSCFTIETESSIGNFYDITNYLMSNKAKNQFVYDILYADVSREQIYTASGLYSKEDFSDNLYAYTGTDLFRSIESIGPGQLSLLPLETASQYGRPLQIVTISIPVSYRYQENKPAVDGCAVFIIEKSTLDAMIRSVMQSENAVGALYYGQTPVYCSQESLLSFLPQEELLAESIALEGEPYGVFSGRVSQENSLLSVVGLVPENEINAVRNLILGSVAIVAFLTLALCSLLIACFMKLNYQPLQTLFLFARKQQGGELPRMNEMKTIQYVVSKLSEKQNELLAHNQTLQRERCFYTLMDGTLPLGESFRTQCLLAGIRLDGPCHQIIILEKQENVVLYLRDTYIPSSHLYWDDTISPNEIFLVLSGTQEELEKDCAQIRQWEIGKGIGTVCDTLEGLRASRDEALHQLHRTKEHTDTLPLAEIRSAQAAISSGNMKQFQFLARSVADCVRQADSLESASMTYALFIMGSLNQIRSQEDPFVTLSQLEQKYAFPPANTENAALSVLHFADELCRAAREKNEKGKFSIQTVLDYIGSSCFDPTFSIKTMADHFGVSSSNLSHFFKNKTGLSLSQHIQSIRLTKARELLLSTSLPVAEIISMIGYTDVSSFIRRFKQETGMTPGEFRSAPPAAPV